jgi:hypothetical protein
MIILDVSFGIFAFMPQGWVFMLFVILMECLVMTRVLMLKWFNRKIYIVTSISNILSGLFGIITTLKLNGGWLLVVWFPWVSSHEIDIHQRSNLRILIIYYAVAFLITILLELVNNILFLRKNFSKSQIIKSTMLANVLSYAIGSFVLYYFSFH